MLADAVMLSKCTDEADFRVNMNCIQSLITSETTIRFNIVVVESNRGFHDLGMRYDVQNVSVIIPEAPFRFHRFLNTGLDQTKSDLIIFSNNDVTYHRGWLSEMLRVKQLNPSIRSFSPFDRNGPFLSYDDYYGRPFHLGYRVPVEFVGWCFVVERSVFEQIGRFDERYDLYFGDNDFARTLKRESILHAMVPTSFVEHHGGYTTKNYDASGTPQYALDKERYVRKWGDTKWRTSLYRLVRKIRDWIGRRSA